MEKKQKPPKQCPIMFGFEMYFQGEKDETRARKLILPLIKRLYDWGSGLVECKTKAIKLVPKRNKEK